MRLDKKIVVVTGGYGLLGKEFCESISRNGGTVVVADINDEAKDFALTLSSGLYFRLDINSKESVSECIDYLHSKFGRIDAIVNNAYPRNRNYGRDFLEVEYSDFVENVNMNLGGYFLCSQEFIKYFLRQGYGHVINIASIYGVVAPRFEIYQHTSLTTPVEYAVIKSALIHFTKYCANYLKGKNIRSNSISLGGILNNKPQSFIEKYNIHCLNKGMLSPKDIAGTLVFLLSDESEMINGQNILVDDGFTL